MSIHKDNLVSRLNSGYFDKLNLDMGILKSTIFDKELYLKPFSGSGPTHEEVIEEEYLRKKDEFLRKSFEKNMTLDIPNPVILDSDSALIILGSGGGFLNL